MLPRNFKPKKFTTKLSLDELRLHSKTLSKIHEIEKSIKSIGSQDIQKKKRQKLFVKTPSPS